MASASPSAGLLVDPHARAAARRAERRRVDADEHPRAARLVEADDRLLAVPRPQEILEHTGILQARTGLRYTHASEWPENAQS